MFGGMQRKNDTRRVTIVDVDLNHPIYPLALGKNEVHGDQLYIDLSQGIGPNIVVPHVGEEWIIKRPGGARWILSHRVDEALARAGGSVLTPDFVDSHLWLAMETPLNVTSGSGGEPIIFDELFEATDDWPNQNIPQTGLSVGYVLLPSPGVYSVQVVADWDITDPLGLVGNRQIVLEQPYRTNDTETIVAAALAMRGPMTGNFIVWAPTTLLEFQFRVLVTQDAGGDIPLSDAEVFVIKLFELSDSS